MKIRISEIPSNGAIADFSINSAVLNKRLTPPEGATPGTKLLAPEIRFKDDARVSLKLDLEGTTVRLRGTATGAFETACARCGEPAEKVDTAEIDMVLKPISARDQAAEEDLHFGYYDGKEVDCGAIAEEFIVLNIPYTSLCSEGCRGLCPECGINLNREQCKCEKKQPGTSPFSVLSKLKDR